MEIKAKDGHVIEDLPGLVRVKEESPHKLLLALKEKTKPER